MLHPLASLWRHQARVSFYTSGSLNRHAPSAGDAFAHSDAMPARRRFSSADDAFNYLRPWQGDPSARAELKRILQRCGPSLVSSHIGIDGWLHALAGRLAAGAIEVLEEHGRCAMPGRLVAAASAGAPAVDIAALPSLSALVVEDPVAPDLAPAAPQLAPSPDEADESADSSAARTAPKSPAQSPAASAVDAPEAALQPVPPDALAPIPVPTLLGVAPAESSPSEVAAETPEQTPAAITPEWPEAVDQQAQAQALEQAADSGTPFCEICAKQQPAAAPAPVAPIDPAAAPTPSPVEAAVAEDNADAVAEWQQPDQLAQAQALERAAESGAPFCEICARQQQAQEQAPLVDALAEPDAPQAAPIAPQETPAAPTPDWPQAADQPAQAQALEQAAESGTPFCEICAKQQLTRQETNDG
jgi:hypothetical protein